MKNFKILLTAFSLFLFFQNTSGQGPVGVNLASFRDWSSEFVFKDAFKMCREWTQINALNSATVPGLAVPLRPDGYPQSLPFESGGVQLVLRTFVFTGQVHPLPDGDYTLLSDGNGTVRIQQQGGSGAQLLNSPGSLVFPKQNNGHFMIDILQSDAADPVRNIQLVMPGFLGSYETEPLHPDFLDFLTNFKCIRFMDWMRTNGSTISGWAQRTPVDYYSQTVPFAGNVPYRGVAYEYLTVLCNLLGKDTWVNIPHRADDDYIAQFATFLRDNLDNGLKIYVEYSNELWNTHGDFTQTIWVGEQGVAMGYPGPVSNQRRLFTAKRSADIFRIFEEVFEGQTGRLVKVLAGQAGNADVAQTILNAFLNNLNGVNPDGVGVDALAIAPYFGNFITSATDVGHVLAQAEVSMNSMAFPRMDAHFAMLQNNGWNLPLIAYEGGQHLDGPNAATDALFCEANRHEGMGDLYCQYFNYWYSHGGGLFMHYNSTSSCAASGSWGLKEYTGQPDADAPKFRAVMKPECITGTSDAEQPIGDFALLYPNPTTGLLHFQALAEATIESVEVLDMQGRRLLSAENFPASLDVAGLPGGLYLLVYKTVGGRLGRGRFVKQ